MYASPESWQCSKERGGQPGSVDRTLEQSSTHPDAVPVASDETTSEAVKDEPRGHGGVVLVLTGPCTASLRVRVGVVV